MQIRVPFFVTAGAALALVVFLAGCEATTPLSNSAPVVVRDVDGQVRVYAYSVRRDDVQAAISMAAPGDIVEIPAGQSDWDEPVVMNHGITLEGAGEGQTVVRNLRANYQEPLVIMNTIRGEYYRVTGFTFESVRGGSNDNSDCIIIVGQTDSFRIDHNLFTHGGSHSVWISGAAYGVIDNNKFVNASQEVISIYDQGTGDDSWNRPLTLGSPEAVYIESNDFRFVTKGDHAVTGINGARYVFRYNSVISNEALGSSQIDAHGNFFVDRGTRSFEIYDNVLQSENSYQGMYIRGGTGVIFDNRFSGLYYNAIVFTDYRAWGTPSGETAGPCGYSACTYPAPDQISDTYVWGNTYNGRVVEPYVTTRGLDRQDIQAGRDYFLEPSPDYTPYPYPFPLPVELSRN